MREAATAHEQIYGDDGRGWSRLLVRHARTRSWHCFAHGGSGSGHEREDLVLDPLMSAPSMSEYRGTDFTRFVLRRLDEGWILSMMVRQDAFLCLLNLDATFSNASGAL